MAALATTLIDNATMTWQEKELLTILLGPGQESSKFFPSIADERLEPCFRKASPGSHATSSEKKKADACKDASWSINDYEQCCSEFSKECPIQNNKGKITLKSESNPENKSRTQTTMEEYLVLDYNGIV